MENRLKNLKKSMDTTIFSQLNFTEQHRKEIHEKMSRESESENDILLAVLQLLVQEKMGYDLAKLLRGRGIRKFEDNEGALYAFLHRLEGDGCLQSSWDESTIKYYCVTNKGRKLLKKIEKQHTSKQNMEKPLSLNQLTGGEA